MTLLEASDHPWRRPPPSANQRDLRRLLEDAAAVVFDVPLEELRASSRRAAEVAFARQSAMYLAHVVLGMRYSEIGRLFGRDRTTAAHACRTVEDRRDDPLIDLQLEVLEAVCGETLFVAAAPEAQA